MTDMQTVALAAFGLGLLFGWRILPWFLQLLRYLSRSIFDRKTVAQSIQDAAQTMVKAATYHPRDKMVVFIWNDLTKTSNEPRVMPYWLGENNSMTDAGKELLRLHVPPPDTKVLVYLVDSEGNVRPGQSLLVQPPRPPGNRLVGAHGEEIAS